MNVLVSPFFAAFYSYMSDRLPDTRLDEAAILKLSKMQNLAEQGHTNAYCIRFTTSTEETFELPLRQFIPKRISQFMEGVEIEILPEGDLPQWQLEALYHASKAMKCEMHEALLAMMNAMVFSMIISKEIIL